MINAGAETVAEKPAFRDTLRRRPCLVLANGFYEWQRAGGTKRPMRIVMQPGEPFAFPGFLVGVEALERQLHPFMRYHHDGGERLASAHI